MINIIPNTTFFRRVPFQSGDYSLELDILLSNHNHSIDFAVSGGGSVFFRFGSDSGNYYASGDRKLYFDATIPNTNLNYSFVFGSEQYDIYNEDGIPLVVGGIKSTGICERVWVRTTDDAAGEFSLILRGNRPSFSITSGLTFPVLSQSLDKLTVQNNTNTPFYLLSGTIDSLNNVSGANTFPLLVDAQNSVDINFSGSLESDDDRAISFVLNADYINTVNVLSITGTLYSGSGYTITAPGAPSTNDGGFVNSLWFITNTGTIPLKFTPTISKITSGISVGVPTYSGNNLKNFHSGYFDTTSSFYVSDKITWTGGAFHIIQNNAVGINLIGVTGATNQTGLMAGTTSGSACGQSFSLPFDFQITGVTATIAATGLGFTTSDNVFVSVFEGVGVTGTPIATSASIPCLSLPSGLSSGSGFYFRFSNPVEVLANNEYSFVLSGNPEFVGNSLSTPARHVMWMHNGGNPYVGGSGFVYDGSTTRFLGDALISLDWMPALNTNRYKVNVVDGATSNFYTIDSGTYDKNQGHNSFVFTDLSVEALPNRPVSFGMRYTGVVSGTNFVQVSFPELGYQAIITGVTT